MTALRPRPLSIGETLDLAFKICVGRFVPLAKAVFFVVAPVALVTSVVELRVLPSGFFETGDSSDSIKVTAEELQSALGGLALIGLLGALGSLFASAACFRIVAEALLGRQTDWTVSLRYAVVRLPSVLWVTLLSGVVIVLGLVLCIVPGLWLAVLLSVAVPALLAEGLRGRGALERSRGLVRGRFWPVVGTLLAGTVLAGVVSFAISSVGAAADPETSIGFVISWATQTAASTIATPILAAVSTVLYFELRVRKEGLTLEALATQLGVELTSGAAWPVDVPEETDAASAESAESAPPPFWPPPPGWQASGTSTPGEQGEAAQPAARGGAPPFWPPPPGCGAPGHNADSGRDRGAGSDLGGDGSATRQQRRLVISTAPTTGLGLVRRAVLGARQAVEVDSTDLRAAAALMLAAGAVLPLLPGEPGVPCPLRSLTGIPCPLCGMTTSVESVLHLDLVGAFSADPAGILAVIFAIVLLVRRPTRIALHQGVLSGALATMWLFELHRFGLY